MLKLRSLGNLPFDLKGQPRMVYDLSVKLRGSLSHIASFHPITCRCRYNKGS